MFFGDARLIASLEITVHLGAHIVMANVQIEWRATFGLSHSNAGLDQPQINRGITPRSH